MTRTDIKILLLRKDLTLASLARAAGVPRTHASEAIHGRSKTPWVRRSLAEALGMPFEDLWGEPDPGVDRLPAGRPKSVTPDKDSASPPEA